MQTNEDLTREFLAFCESVYKDALHIAKQARAGHTGEADAAATELARKALLHLENLLTAQGQSGLPQSAADALPVHADPTSPGETPLKVREEKPSQENLSHPQEPQPFSVQVTCDLINSIDGPGEYMEHERTVVLSPAEAQRIKQANPAITEFLNEEDPQHPQLLARTQKLQELGFATLAEKIDAEADRQVAAFNQHRQEEHLVLPDNPLGE